MSKNKLSKFENKIQNYMNEERNKRSLELFDKNECELQIAELMKLDQYMHDIEYPVWKWIEISKDGTKCIVSNTGIIKDYKGKELKQYSNSTGYSIVWIRSITNPKICYPNLVHRLVAQAFIPNPENKPEVNHIKNDPTINWVGNLEWVTSKENKEHMIKLGNQITGMKHKNSKFTDKQIHYVCKLLEDENLNLREISRKSGVSIRTINHIRFDNGWPHISRLYNINKSKLNNGPKFSELSNLIITMVKSGMNDESIYEELDKSGLSSNYTRKSINDRIYRIRKNIV